MKTSDAPVPPPALEIVAEATAAGARRFLARVKDRPLKTYVRANPADPFDLTPAPGTASRAVSTKEVGEGLVVQAELDHAVVKGTKPKEVFCKDCGAVLKVAEKGGVPKRCQLGHGCRAPKLSVCVGDGICPCPEQRLAQVPRRRCAADWSGRCPTCARRAGVRIAREGRTPEQKRAGGRTMQASLSPRERSVRARAASAALTSEQKLALASAGRAARLAKRTKSSATGSAPPAADAAE